MTELEDETAPAVLGARRRLGCLIGFALYAIAGLALLRFVPIS